MMSHASNVQNPGDVASLEAGKLFKLQLLAGDTWTWEIQITGTWPGLDGGPRLNCWSMANPDLAGTGERMVTIPIHIADGERYISLTVTDGQDRVDTAIAVLKVENRAACAANPIKEEAAWTEGANVYGVIVRNFGSNGFQSVIEDPADLGIAAHRLAPITHTIPDSLVFEMKDYSDVRSEYATIADFNRLVQGAYKRCIRALMDFLLKLTSLESPFFHEAEKNGPSSPYCALYKQDERGSYTYYFDWTHLPNLTFENPEVRCFMTENYMFWVREIDVSGFWAYVACGIEEPRPDYWVEFDRVKPDGLLIVVEGACALYYFNIGFDAVYDWTDDLGIWAWSDAFGVIAPISTWKVEALVHFSESGGYDAASSIFRFLDCTDTRLRFNTICGVDLYRVALAILLNLPGLPFVCTWREVGAEFESRATIGPIDWTVHNDLRPHCTKLKHPRKQHRWLKSRELAALVVEPANQLSGYLRREANGSSPLLVLLDLGHKGADAAMT